jgi:geranylgeranyl pyrophosphate synthase
MLLQKLQQPYNALLNEVDRRILEIVKKGADENLSQLLDSAPISGGKKIRSTFLFMMLTPTSDHGRAPIDLAAALEMLHQASLVHDDVLDHAQTRRDRPTLHRLVDNTMAVLVGDYLFIKALSLVQSLGQPAFMGIKLSATLDLIFGQIDDMKPRIEEKPSFNGYLEILERKTGALFGAAAEMASLLRGDQAGSTAAARRFGRAFGVLFQLQDDVLDLFSLKTGKDRWGDLREGKWTLPTLLLSQALPGLRLFPFDESRILEIEDGLRVCGIAERCQEVLNEYRMRTEAMLSELSDGVSRDDLLRLIDYVCRRER